MYLEHLQVEAEGIGKQKMPVEGEQKGSGLVSESRNSLQDERRKQTRLEGKFLPNHAPCILLPGVQSTCIRQKVGKPEAVQEKWVTVKPSALPEDLYEATQAPSAFLVFVQHMPANDGGEAYDERTWHSTERLDLKHFTGSIVNYGMHSCFLK